MGDQVVLKGLNPSGLLSMEGKVEGKHRDVSIS